MKGRYYLITLSILAVGLLIKFSLSWPDDQLRYIQCNVGQGDAILITHGFKQVLVDGGKDRQVLICLQKHMPFWDRQIDVVVATHPDKDHVGGLDEVVKRYQITTFVYNGQDDQGEEWQQLNKLISDKNIELLASYELSEIEIEKIKLSFLWPTQKIVKLPNLDDNNLSVVTKLNYNNFSVLLTGDISAQVEKLLISQKTDLSAQVLKISHHGSKTASSESFLAKVMPTIATIGVGQNKFGHPHQEVIRRLATIEVDTFRTDQDNDVVVVSDGQKFELE